jgi:hypothetical protein
MKGESITLQWAMFGLALFCGGLIAFFILGMALTPSAPFNPHIPLVLMGVLSFGLTAAALKRGCS